MANYNVNVYEENITYKRFKTQNQMIDALVCYIDINYSDLSNNDRIYITLKQPYTIRGSALMCGDYPQSNSIKPFNGVDYIYGSTAKMEYSSASIRFYYNNSGSDSAYVSWTPQSGYYQLPIMVVAITNDNVWLPTIYLLTYNHTSSTTWSIALPTSTQYGYIQNTLTNDRSLTYIKKDNINSSFGEALKNNEIEIENDPYQNAGESGEGGGSGSFDYTGDTIPEPSLPTVGAAATGFVSLFNPTTSQLQTLSDYLWSPLFDLDTIKRLYADPMQQFIGLSLVPVPVPSAGTKTIQVGGVSTGIAINYVASNNQFVEVNCGSITFSSSSLTASYLDFLPYTKTQLYLPYIGIVDVSTDDIMDKTVSIKYHVDILTGGCIAYIFVNSSVMYQYSGQCAINIPLSSIDWSTTISSALNLVSSAIGGIISGASVPLTGGAGALVGAQGIANMGASAVNAAVGMKPTVNKSGAIGGSSGIMAVQKPYLIVTCPNLARAKKQDYFLGYPSFINKTVANCSGFCSFEEIYLSGIGLTDEEMEELTAIMKEGVYL